jgi:hypothetical protein
MADLSPTLTLHSLEKAGAPSSATRSIKEWAEKNLTGDSTGFSAKLAKAKLHGTAFAEGVRNTGEGAVFGAILGGVHGLLPQGLDFPIPGTKHHLPLDGAGALLGLVAGTFAAAEPYGVGKTLTNGGASCATVYSFRKMNDLMIAMRERKSGATPGGGAAGIPGKIGKASFSGDGGWAPGSAKPGDIGEDPVVAMARGL